MYVRVVSYVFGRMGIFSMHTLYIMYLTYVCVSCIICICSCTTTDVSLLGKAWGAVSLQLQVRCQSGPYYSCWRAALCHCGRTVNMYIAVYIHRVCTLHVRYVKSTYSAARKIQKSEKGCLSTAMVHTSEVFFKIKLFYFWILRPNK